MMMSLASAVLAAFTLCTSQPVLAHAGSTSLGAQSLDGGEFTTELIDASLPPSALRKLQSTAAERRAAFETESYRDGDCDQWWVPRAMNMATNQKRLDKGLRPVQCNQALSDAAVAWSEYMCTRYQENGAGNALTHGSGSTGDGVGTRCSQYDGPRNCPKAPRPCCGENVGYQWVNSGYGWWKHVQAWYRSSGHRRNMLQPQYTIAGHGAYRCGNGPVFATQIFVAAKITDEMVAYSDGS